MMHHCNPTELHIKSSGLPIGNVSKLEDKGFSLNGNIKQRSQLSVISGNTLTKLTNLLIMDDPMLDAKELSPSNEKTHGSEQG